MKNFLEKFRRKGQQAEDDKTERATGLGRRTREEIAKWNQMTALRFQTGGRHQISPASLRGTQTETYESFIHVNTYRVRLIGWGLVSDVVSCA